jgi:hypothetical protein
VDGKLGGWFWNYLTPPVSEGTAWSSCMRLAHASVKYLSRRALDKRSGPLLSKKHGYTYIRVLHVDGSSQRVWMKIGRKDKPKCQLLANSNEVLASESNLFDFH